MERVLGNIFVRPMGGDAGLAPGQDIKGHAHNFDHVSVFFVGTWRVRRWKPAVNQDGEQLTLPGTDQRAWILIDDFERQAPFELLIEAACRHEFAFLGNAVPPWMAPYLDRMAAADAEAFRAAYAKGVGKAWCIYSHRDPQGDVTVDYTGWHPAYV